MARLLDWPIGLVIVGREPMSGPRTVGSAATEGLTGYLQTTSSVFGVWRWSLSLQPMRKQLFRRYRGMVAALHGGANAVRVPFCDPDGLSWAESGVVATSAQIRAGELWEPEPSGAAMPWSNGQNWRIGRPWASVDAAAAKGDTIIDLADEYWGHNLLGGEWLGFVPFHFGLYIVTEVLAPGQYRVWPPLRKALTTSSRATLTPVMAMKLENESAASASRGRVMADSNTMTLIEVEDSDVRVHFAD